MMVDPLPADLHIQSQHSETKPSTHSLTSGRPTDHQQGSLGFASIEILFELC